MIIMVPWEIFVLLCALASLPLYTCNSFLENNVCTEQREYSTETKCNRGPWDCGEYMVITSKYITCTYISVNYLKSYTETIRFSSPYFLDYNYPITLKVTNSNIPVLPPSTFQNLKNITVLILEGITLKTIMPVAFNFLDQLKELYLGKNELTTISDGIFNTLISLQKLDLSKNRITTITPHAFVGIPLYDLNLNHNNISDLDEALMQSLTIHLSILDVSQNTLKSISGFHGLNVRSLNLSHNDIHAVDFGDIEVSQFIDISFNNITDLINFNLTTASKIFLSHNKIADIKRNNNASVLDISYNNLEMIDSELFSNMLEELYVSHNFIVSLNVDTFVGLEKLRYLYLDNNNLSSIPNSCFKDLTSLTDLNLSGNNLSSFTFGTFDNLLRLNVLDISNNNFKYLPQYSFHSLSEVKYLYFQGNEISNINIDDLLGHLPHLVKIDLNNNVWSCQKLVNIVHKLKSRNIYFPNGNSWEESNIHGIKCYETSEQGDSSNSNSGTGFGESKLNRFFNEDFTKTLLYKYFNQDFKESEFFKYLESLKNSNQTVSQNNDLISIQHLLDGVKLNSDNASENFKNTEIYNYFNKDFKNSSFFKYLEDFKVQQKVSKLDKVDNNELDDIASSFKDIVKELRNISKAYTPQKKLGENDMYNYFNKDFKSSNFFKYLENLRLTGDARKQPEDINEIKTEKLVEQPEKTIVSTNYIGYVNAILLLCILCVIGIVAYRSIFQTKKYSLPYKEEVELM